VTARGSTGEEDGAAKEYVGGKNEMINSKRTRRRMRCKFWRTGVENMLNGYVVNCLSNEVRFFVSDQLRTFRDQHASLFSP
jgi:hypothetical protein